MTEKKYILVTSLNRDISTNLLVGDSLEEILNTAYIMILAPLDGKDLEGFDKQLKQSLENKESFISKNEGRLKGADLLFDTDGELENATFHCDLSDGNIKADWQLAKFDNEMMDDEDRS